VPGGTQPEPPPPPDAVRVITPLTMAQVVFVEQLKVKDTPMGVPWFQKTIGGFEICGTGRGGAGSGDGIARADSGRRFGAAKEAVAATRSIVSSATRRIRQPMNMVTSAASEALSASMKYT
jgi:hypothetical protein